MAEKFCIFCGKKPENKNMEHVIPQWLIKLTGREKKDVFENFPASHKHLTFMQYKFPACEKCNSEYSDLESKVRPVVVAILEGKPISGEQISLLLDWFDKVRVGVWLAEMCYDPEIKRQVHPNFYINSRVGHADRMLSIKKLKMPAGSQGISIIGIKSPLFYYFPSVFALEINNLLFTNASNACLVAPRVGFPYLRDSVVVNPFKPELECTFVSGRNKVTNPIIKPFIPNKESITFYQPILQDVNGVPPFKLFNEYTLQHSYDVLKGQGGVFVQKGNQGNIRYLNQTDRVGTKLNAVEPTNFIVDTLKLQNAVHEMSIGQTDESKLRATKNATILKLYEQGLITLR